MYGEWMKEKHVVARVNCSSEAEYYKKELVAFQIVLVLQLDEYFVMGEQGEDLLVYSSD